MAEISRPRLMRLLPGCGGGAAGLLVAGTAALMPVAVLEDLVAGSGIAAILPVAAPPLGITARAVLALGGGMGVAAIVWAALYLLIGPGRAPRATAVAAGPMVRRADEHPDAPPRHPLSASDLPSPPRSPPTERPLPGDLDVPLAAFDPAALPAVPREPVRAVAPLATARLLAQGERLETFTLAPPPPPAAPPRRAEPSIDALIRRLEQGARRRTAAAS